MTKRNSSKPFESAVVRGFTLLEVLIAVSIVLTAIGMSFGFLTEAAKINFISGEKNEINQDLRNVVDRLSRDARQANFFLLYRSEATEDRDSSGDRLFGGNSGDFLVLIEKAPHSTYLDASSARQPRPIRGLTIYFRSVTGVENGQAVGPVRVFRRTFNPAITDLNSIRNPELLYPTEQELAAAPRIMAFSEGLANGRLFYNHFDRTIMINGKILHGNAAKRVTDTYNFSISPRG